ncbi:uncharacterized protein LOC110427998 [Herrania umbratica]|uniref:Uncharacterized protein LOC110427998 n=1 Tax=Herrania umbratica TaxID=108875 RepID=A0A6J1BJQ5_9ROSI|nr:uncharacterized protein LOC110427998 [Herrania umbratica]
MALQRGYVCGGSRKRRAIEGDNCSQWSELPAVLLELILNRLGAIEFLIFACVCKPWRAVAIALKQEFMASHGPLVFLMPTKARKYCYFYNIFDDRLYRTALPHLAGNKCLGFTCGYLVLGNSEMKKKEADIWLVNPFTRHELHFPRPPKPYAHVILASLAKSDSESILVAFSRLQHPFLQFCGSGDFNWTVLEYAVDHWMITDVAVFKGKIYVLTSHGEVGTLNLSSSPKVALLHVKHAQVKDFERMEWEMVKLEGQMLFLGDMKCCGLSFPTPSGEWCRQHFNTVCHLEEQAF